MKILESRPHRYDCGINLLTGGQASRTKGDIVRNFVRPGMAVLDVGCGTGDLAVRAAQVGALVTGVDISEGMLAVARERIKQNGLENKVVLHHAGVVEIDTLFDENSFDLITSTLVISELYGEEREWAFRELYRILKSANIFFGLPYQDPGALPRTVCLVFPDGNAARHECAPVAHLCSDRLGRPSFMGNCNHIDFLGCGDGTVLRVLPFAIQDAKPAEWYVLWEYTASEKIERMLLS